MMNGIAQEIASFVEAKGTTRSALARLAGLSVYSVHEAYRKGKASPKTLAKLRRVMGSNVPPSADLGVLDPTSKKLLERVLGNEACYQDLLLDIATRLRQGNGRSVVNGVIEMYLASLPEADRPDCIVELFESYGTKK